MTALDELERIAKARGWRLAWDEFQLLDHPSLTMRSLDIWHGRRLLTVAGPFWSVATRGGVEGLASRVAKIALEALPSRGARRAA